ncbi:hypothetical protein ACFL21_04780 [Patescibacteria group bacterium]
MLETNEHNEEQELISESQKAKEQPDEYKPLVHSKERPEIAEKSIRELKKSLELLGIEKWELPEITIEYSGEGQFPDKALAQTQVNNNEYKIICLKELSTSKGEERLHKENPHVEIPNLDQVLKHEFAHIAMWSITGFKRQPTVRLLDEGWASLVEQLDTEKSKNLKDLKKETKEKVRKGIEENPEIYKRCLDLRNPISHLDDSDLLEKLNSIEYEVGRAFLLWIQEIYGIEGIIDLLSKSPQSSRRNDGGSLEMAAVDDSLHRGAREYKELFEAVIKGKIEESEIPGKGLKWERKQFQSAVTEITGLKIDEVQKKFKEWLV